MHPPEQWNTFFGVMEVYSNDGKNIIYINLNMTRLVEAMESE